MKLKYYIPIVLLAVAAAAGWARYYKVNKQLNGLIASASERQQALVDVQKLEYGRFISATDTAITFGAPTPVQKSGVEYVDYTPTTVALLPSTLITDLRGTTDTIRFATEIPVGTPLRLDINTTSPAGSLQDRAVSTLYILPQ